MSLDGWAGQLGLLVAAFVVGTIVAAAFGAANLGVALSVGTIAFAAAYMWIIAKR
ncbi:MAG TPA: hypothetical protein VFR97_02175 [Capillimicrobium sp.]|nr:hypothetical protein [Capillimicrobium sp.]